jgi:hypothetical protein
VIHNDDSQDIPIQMNTTSESFTLPDEPTDDYYITVWASGQLLWNARIPPEALEQPVLTGTLVLEKLDEN